MKMRGVGALWAVLAVAAATGLFLLKYEVIALEGELAALTGAIEADRRAIHVLRAEWSYFNDPDTLNGRAGAQLNLVPVDPDHMRMLDALPFRPHPVARAGGDLPIAPVLPPRVLHPGSANAIPVPGQKPTVLADVATMRTEP